MAGEQRYLAYMVRLWTVRNNDELIWRASIENAHTGERHAFADLAGLFGFLREVTGVLSDGQGNGSNAIVPDDSQDGSGGR